MAAGVTDRVWEIADIVALVTEAEKAQMAQRAEKRDMAISRHGDALGHGQTNI